MPRVWRGAGAERAVRLGPLRAPGGAFAFGQAAPAVNGRQGVARCLAFPGGGSGAGSGRGCGLSVVHVRCALLLCAAQSSKGKVDNTCPEADHHPLSVDLDGQQIPPVQDMIVLGTHVSLRHSGVKAVQHRIRKSWEAMFVIQPLLRHPTSEGGGGGEDPLVPCRGHVDSIVGIGDTTPYNGGVQQFGAQYDVHALPYATCQCAASGTGRIGGNVSSAAGYRQPACGDTALGINYPPLV